MVNIKQRVIASWVICVCSLSCEMILKWNLCYHAWLILLCAAMMSSLSEYPFMYAGKCKANRTRIDTHTRTQTLFSRTTCAVNIVAVLLFARLLCTSTNILLWSESLCDFLVSIYRFDKRLMLIIMIVMCARSMVNCILCFSCQNILVFASSR